LWPGLAHATGVRGRLGDELTRLQRIPLLIVDEGSYIQFE
jgi:hypothetical protein